MENCLSLCHNMKVSFNSMKGKKILALFFVLPVCLAAAEYRVDTLYSKWVIDSRMGSFNNKTQTVGFATPDHPQCTATWDYVPGLVAKGILKAYTQYKDSTWSAYWLEGVRNYADAHMDITFDEYKGKDRRDDIDWLNAAKIFFELHEHTGKDMYKEKVEDACRVLSTQHGRIQAPLPGAGGFWHKGGGLVKGYDNQMWLDGLYMGAAMYGEYVGRYAPEDEQAWADIALQFDTVFHYTWNEEEKLCHHAWSAAPWQENSFWADPKTGRSAEFWARGMGWFFAALVDVLEYMPAGVDVNASGVDARTRLMGYLEKVEKKKKNRQDNESGCWYQLLKYDDTFVAESYNGVACGHANYLEASASSMFTYAYLKAMRLGLLDKGKYADMAVKAYKGLIEEFVVENADGTISIVSSCESAGLGGGAKSGEPKYRDGSAAYYLCGYDVPVNDHTEGKALGPFIMASLEYELLEK